MLQINGWSKIKMILPMNKLIRHQAEIYKKKVEQQKRKNQYKNGEGIFFGSQKSAFCSFC